MTGAAISSDFEPMGQVRKSFRVDWYRCPIDPEVLRELTRRSDTQGWLQAGGHLALAFATGALAYYCYAQSWWLALALALFVHGTVVSFFKGLAVHELGHGTVFKTKWLNALMLRVYCTLGWHNHYEYAMSHTYHHLYTLHPRGDREVVLPKRPWLHPLFMLQLFTVNIYGGADCNILVPTLRETFKTACGRYDREWISAVYTDQPQARRLAVNWARWLLLFHGGVLVISLLLQLWIVPVLVSLSTFMGNWLKYFVGLPMHCGLRDDVADFRKCVRSITLDPLSEYLYWHMNWHTEHHMFAAVPCYNLKKLHRAVAADMPKPRTLIGAWREMRNIWHRQRHEPSYQYDTPLPAIQKPATTIAQQDLAASLGDLAPQVLRDA